MAQASVVMDGDQGADAVLIELNDALEALLTDFSGATAPADPTQWQKWIDTSIANKGTLKVWDGSGWRAVWTVDTVAGTLTLAVPAATESVSGIVEKSTSGENTAGTATDKFPDVAGVKLMLDTFGVQDLTARDMAVANAVDIAILGDSGADGLTGGYQWYATADDWDTTTNAAHDAANNRYTPDTTSVGLDDADKTGSANITSNEANPSTISNGGNNEAAYFDLGGTAVTGDFDLTFTLPASSFTQWNAIGLFAASESGTFNAGVNSGALPSMTDSFYVQVNTGGSGAGAYKGGTLAQAITFAGSDVIRITRVGSAIAVYQNGSLRHTWTGQTTATMLVAFGHSNGSSVGAVSLTAVDISDDNNGTILNATLNNAVPAGQKPASNPADLAVYGLIYPAGSITMGTDVIFGAKRASGDSFTEEATAGDYTFIREYEDGGQLWRADFDVSGGTAANDPEAQIRTVAVDVAVKSMVIRGDGGNWNGS